MDQRTRTYIAVAIGGALGSLARWLVSIFAAALFGRGFPWGTLLVNVAGSFLIGFYFTITDSDGRYLVGPAVRQFVLAGVCGGLTTFSSFSLETVLLARDSQLLAAAIYVGASVSAWLVCVWFGHAIGMLINRLVWRHE